MRGMHGMHGMRCMRGMRGMHGMHGMRCMRGMRGMHTGSIAFDVQQAITVVYAKASDHVDHPTAMKKMAALGVSQIILRWINSFLMDRQQRVKKLATLIGLSDWSVQRSVQWSFQWCP